MLNLFFFSINKYSAIIEPTIICVVGLLDKKLIYILSLEKEISLVNNLKVKKQISENKIKEQKIKIMYK
jgi:hypothetical protein